jgi:hypothetical protein
MADIPDGIDLIRSRMQRGQRTPPIARAVRAPGASVTVAGPASDDVPSAGRGAPQARRPRVPSPPQYDRPQLSSDTPTANLALRVRRPLDDHLADLVHEFRREGVRTSKVELVEMLLWELPGSHTEIRPRLAQFRQTAARSGGDLTP